MDKLREEFETWLKTDHLFTPNELEWQPERNCYAIYGVHLAWCAWRASRTALAFDLPAACAEDEYFIDGVFQPMRYERDVERALKAAGISVKGDV
ncbi:hypothetical protein [Pantoea sp. BAV 3049]|uniref:hypothetical protein n=1 Tax=Pantoea sp. BAV 3049 TaxID=2654188 RepID=UPI0018EED0E3|nr:hypothetical protein [Pantoea sp. BAV 3049]